MKTNRSVERAMSALMTVCQSESPIGLTEISSGVGLDKATTLRLLNTLANDDFVCQQAENRSYVAGSGIYNFWPNEIRKTCRPHLQTLLDDTQETICLIAPRGNERVCLDVIEPDRELRIVAPIGRAVPIYAGAAGRVLMAHKSEQQVNKILAECELKAYTIKSVTDRKLYCDQLTEVREQGYAYNVDEVTLDTSAIAVPIFDAQQNVIAAIAVRAPGTRMTKKTVTTIVPKMLACAEIITSELVNTQSPGN